MTPKLEVLGIGGVEWCFIGVRCILGLVTVSQKVTESHFSTWRLVQWTAEEIATSF